ncbi:MAG: hypothetical protein N2049_06225 [Anaerolineales bacterium]|nr:hypothetical protein [Anaerolineales bacterium]
MLRSLRLLILHISILLSMILAACTPQAQTVSHTTSLSPATATPAHQTLHLLHAEAKYLGQLPTQPHDFKPETSGATCNGVSGFLASPKAVVEGEMLKVYVCYDDTIEYSAFHIYLDTEKTGKGFKVSGLQAEFMVENDSLFRYAGYGGDWRWEFIAPVASFETSEGQAAWNLPLSILRATSGNIVFEVTDKNWDTLARTTPITFRKE